MTATISHEQTRVRPGRDVLTAVGWRAALVVVAAIAVALETPVWGRLPLSLAAAVAVGTFFLRRYGRRGVLDVVLVLAGGGLVALALLGLVLNLLPFGLGPVGWALAVGVLELAVLAFLALFRAPHVETRSDGGPAPSASVATRLPGIAWGVVAAAVLVGAVVYSTGSYDATHVSPLAMSAEPDGTAVTITVSAGAQQGPFALDLVTADGRTTIASDVRIAAGASYSTRITDPAQRAVVQLVPAGQAAPVRQLILDDVTGGTR
jgi:hypothetical protein